MKNVSPIKQLDRDAAQHRTEADGQGQSHTVDAHRKAATVRRKDLENRHHDERLNAAGGRALQHAAKNDHAVVFGKTADKAADGEDQQRSAKSVTLTEDRNHPGVEKLARHHGHIKGRGHQLRLILTDAECAHDIGNGNIDDGAGNHHDERGCHPRSRHQDAI